jgi:hypothetical protein
MIWVRVVRSGPILMAAVSLSLAASLAADAQSLAETARKERERREAIRDSSEESRTLTGRDLAAAKGRVANEGAVREAEADEDEEQAGSPPRDTSEPRREAAGETGLEADAAARSQKERTWRERAGRARDRLERAREDHLYWQRALHLGQGWRTDENGKRVMLSLRSLQGRAQRAEDELRAAEEAWEKLEEDARRAFVPPGWLR